MSNLIKNRYDNELLSKLAFDLNAPKIKLVSFDLDDTLIKEIHSVMLPCILNGKEKEHSIIQKREDSGELDYISADYLRAELLEGLAESKIAESFNEIARPLENIKNVIDALHDNGILCIVITVGPKQVAKVACDIWGFDDYYGSDYEIRNGKFTGKIIEYIKAENKVDCLKDYCRVKQIKPAECIAVGDGSTDIPLFEYCGNSIAINASLDAREKADNIVDTQDLMDIMRFIVEEL